MAGGEDQLKNDWVARTLGFTIPTAPRGAVDYAKLLLEWRSAQLRAAEQLGAFGPAFLALDEVKQDFRFTLVSQAVSSLPRLVPEFGDALADDLDRAMSAPTPAGGAEHLRGAMGTIAGYRQQLAGVPALAELAGLARRAIKLDLDVVGLLDDTLDRIEQEISARIAAVAA